MDVLFLIGRILYGGYFVILAANYVRNAKRIVVHKKFKKPGLGRVLLYVGAVLSFFGGIGVILGIHTSLALLLLVIFLIFTSFRIHDYWNADEPSEIAVEMSHFTRNIALLGAALAMYSILTPWPLSV